MVVILDYGVGNLASVRNMFKRVGVEAIISSDPQVVLSAEKIVLPGVGAFDYAMQKLNASGLRKALDSKVSDGVPLLGICLGMQLLCSGSEEGKLNGLGYIKAKARLFPPASDIKVPHMGWNQVEKVRSSALTDVLGDDARFYFVHSYYVLADDPEHSLLKASHGTMFDAAICDNNIFGVQFHPEKSHRYGKALFTAFGELS